MEILDNANNSHTETTVEPLIPDLTGHSLWSEHTSFNKRSDKFPFTNSTTHLLVEKHANTTIKC